jgi:uncharacterized membrane protein
MSTNQDYKNAALGALKGNWSDAVIATLIFFFIIVFMTGFEQYASWQHVPGTTLTIFWSGMTFFSIFFLVPLEIGYVNAFNQMYIAGDKSVISNMFGLGFHNYFHLVWGYVLMEIFIFLWTLLLIIPGIIKLFAYSMTPYILVENPELSVNEAIDRSCKMMKGHKFDYFYLWLSFIGWFFLCLLTAGIGFIWLQPYVSTASAAFYNDLKEKEGYIPGGTDITPEAQL